MPPARKQDIKPKPAAKPTVSSLAVQMEVLDEAIKSLDKHFSRQARGTELANHRAAKLERRVDNADERIGVLESTSSYVMERLTHFSGFFRTAQEDAALHEQRITKLEQSSARTDSGSIWSVWAVTLILVELFVLIAWITMAGFRNGAGQRLDDAPSYNDMFLWIGIGSAVVISGVAWLVGYIGGSNKTVTKSTTTSSRTVVETSTELNESASADDTQISVTAVDSEEAQKTQQMPSTAN